MSALRQPTFYQYPGGMALATSPLSIEAQTPGAEYVTFIPAPVPNKDQNVLTFGSAL